MHHGSFARGARRLLAGSLAAALALLGASAAFGAHHITADRSAGRHGREVRDPRHDQTVTANRGGPAGWSAGAVCLGSGYRRAGGSRRVRELQRWLRARGYRPGRVDGRFGPRTRAALLAFQVKHRLRRSGAVDAGTLTALRSRPARSERPAAPPSPRSVLTGSDTAANPAGWSAGAVCLGSGYRRAGGSRRVRALQRWLRARGYRPGRVDGRFGPRTLAALRSFQVKHALPPDGVVDASTLIALRSRPARRQRAQRAASRPPATLARSTVSPAPPLRSGRSGSDPTVLLVIALLLVAGIVVIVAWARTALRESAQPTLEPPPATPATGPAAAQAATPAPGPRRAEPESDLAGDRPAEPGPDHPGAAREPGTPTLEGARRHACGLWCRPPAGLAGARQPAGPGLREPHLGVAEPPSADPPSPLDPVAPQWIERAVDARLGRVLGYVTVPHGQPRETALDPAIETIAGWCKQHGRELTRVIHDIDFGAHRRTDRPGLDYVFAQIAEGAVAGLVLLRTRDLADSLPQLGTRLRRLIEADAFLIALDDRIDTSTTAGRLAARALTQVSDWDRARVTEPSQRTPTRSPRAGAGRPAVRDDPDLSARIQAMRACGLTLQAIADTLNHEQVPTVRGGTHWRPSSVQAAIGYKRPTGRPPGIERPRIRRDPGIEPEERRA